MSTLRTLSVISVAALLCAGCAEPWQPDTTTRANMRSVEVHLPELADALKKSHPDNGTMVTLFQNYLRENPAVYGVAFVPAPVAGSPATNCPYVYRKSGVVTTINLARPDYDYKNMEWFALPVKKHAPIWTKPYFDKGGGDIWMVTYSIPIYMDADNKELYGVVTSDLPVPEMK